MKFIDASCPHCGAPVIMDNKGKGLCEYCGQWVIFDDNTHRYVLEDAYKTGYEFEKGRQQAQAEARMKAGTYNEQASQSIQTPGRRHWFWWVVGWILIYPLPLTILMARNKSLPWWAKMLIIAAGWGSYLLIAFLNRGS